MNEEHRKIYYNAFTKKIEQLRKREGQCKTPEDFIPIEEDIKKVLARIEQNYCLDKRSKEELRSKLCSYNPDSIKKSNLNKETQETVELTDENGWETIVQMYDPKPELLYKVYAHAKKLIDIGQEKKEIKEQVITVLVAKKRLDPFKARRARLNIEKEQY